MRTPALLPAVLLALGTFSGRVHAQELLLELPPRAEVWVAADRADLEAPLRVGAQLELDQAERMFFSPGVAAVWRPRALRGDYPPMLSFAQLGFALQAPTHGDARQAAERGLNLGAAVLVEPAAGATVRILGPLALEWRLFLRLEQQLARVDLPGGDDTHRIAPLLGVAGGQLGLALGPWVTAAELSLGTRLRTGGAMPQFTDVVGRTPRLRVSSALRVWSHVQVFLHVLPLDGAFSRRTSWTLGVAGNLGVTE